MSEPARAEPSAVAVAELPAAAAEALIAWYREAARDLPWRRSREPYRVLVSEIMLQQTRVETVRPRYERFLSRFPDLHALAAADEQEVLAEWSGLGYYRRARSLHALALAVIEGHEGRLPTDAVTLRSMPGIGDYTAAAVSSITADEPHLAVDGNVARVLCRLLAISDSPTRSSTRKRLKESTRAALRTHLPGTLNQAFMELGALICTPRSPDCRSCPVSSFCVAYGRGVESEIPAPRSQPVHSVTEAAAVIERDGRLLLVRGQRPGVLQDMWEFPTLDSRLSAGGEGQAGDAASSAPASLREALTEHLVAAEIPHGPLRRIGQIRHGITNRRITCHVFQGQARNDASAKPSEATPETTWRRVEEMGRLPLAASARKTLALLAG